MLSSYEGKMVIEDKQTIAPEKKIYKTNGAATKIFKKDILENLLK